MAEQPQLFLAQEAELSIARAQMYFDFGPTLD
jgi:hypothetical protein